MTRLTLNINLEHVTSKPEIISTYKDNELIVFRAKFQEGFVWGLVDEGIPELITKTVFEVLGNPSFVPDSISKLETLKIEHLMAVGLMCANHNEIGHAIRVQQFLWLMAGWFEREGDRAAICQLIFSHQGNITHCINQYRAEVKHYQPRVRRVISELVPGAVISKRPFLAEHKPDLLIEVDGKICPVEMKTSEFRKSGIMQLQRYIKAYNAKTGYAVAPKLHDKVKLPSNVKFVEFK